MDTSFDLIVKSALRKTAADEEDDSGKEDGGRVRRRFPLLAAVLAGGTALGAGAWMGYNLAQRKGRVRRSSGPAAAAKPSRWEDPLTALGWSGLTGPATLAGTLGGVGYMKATRGMIRDRNPGLFDKLEARLKAERPNVTLLKDIGGDPYRSGFLPAWMERPVLAPPGDLIAAPGSNPYILAHEMGHATGPKWLSGKGGVFFRRMAPRTNVLSSVGALAADDQGTAQTIANVGSALHLPTLVSEIDASRRGSKLLKTVGGLKGMSRAKAYVGLPTYILNALVPQLAVQSKGALGGYDADLGEARRMFGGG